MAACHPSAACWSASAPRSASGAPSGNTSWVPRAATAVKRSAGWSRGGSGASGSRPPTSVRRPVSGSTRTSAADTEVLLDVGAQLVVADVLALLGGHDLAVAVHEDRGRESAAGGVEDVGHLRAAGVAVGRIGDRILLEELLGGVLGIGAVDAEERHLPAELRAHALEDR